MDRPEWPSWLPGWSSLPWSFTARQRRVLLVVALVLCSAGVVAAANHLSNAVHTSGEIPLSAPSGPTVSVADAGQIDLTNPFPASDTVEIVSSDGNVTVSGADGATLTVDTIEGTFTEVSSIDVIGAPISIDPGDKAAVNVSGDITSLSWRAGMAPDDATTDFTYDSSLGSGSITLHGLSTSTKYAAVDATTNEVLDVATSDGSGAVTFSNLDSGSHDVILETNDGAPTISNRDPADNAELDDDSVTLSADIADADFPNDEVDVEIFHNGDSVHTETITSDSSVSVEVNNLDGGSHTYRIVAEDAFGSETDSGQFSFSVPSELEIRNETDPTQLVDEVTVTVEFYFEQGENPDLVVERNTSDGTVDLTGLPVGEPFVVVADAEGYHTRRIYVDSLFDTQTIYLLNSSVEPVRPTYVLSDYTGAFDSADSVLEIQRNINDSWQTVEGDYFGASGSFTATLEPGVRHRLVVTNVETGAQRDIGSELVVGEPTVALEIFPDDTIVRVPELPFVTFSPSYAQLDAAETNVSAQIHSGTVGVQSYSVDVLLNNGTSNQTIATASGTTNETVSEALNLTDKAGATVYVVVEITDDNGEVRTETMSYIIREVFDNPRGLIPTLLSISDRLPDSTAGMFTGFIALIVTVLAMGYTATRASTEVAALVGVGFIAGFQAISFVGIEILAAAAVAYIAVIGWRRM